MSTHRTSIRDVRRLGLKAVDRISVNRGVQSVLGLVDRWVVAGASDRPVFLGGCPRSGTTLLRTMLHTHPDLAIPRETHFLLESFWRRDEWGDLRITANRRRLVDWIVDDYASTRFRRLEVDPDEARRRMMATAPTLGSVVGTAFVMYSERHDAARWGDKRPMHVQELPIIFGLFPDAQVVNIVRDPRAVVASMKKLGWLDDWYDGTVAGGTDRWVRSVRSGRSALHRYREDQFLELRYEDLLASPGEQLDRICRFAGLSLAHVDQMLSFHETDDEIPDDNKGRYHPLLDEPLTPEAAHKWAEQLTDEEVAFIEHVAREEMAQYGYEPTGPSVAIPRDLRRRWRTIRAEKDRGRPGPRTARHRYPLAARLTTAQRRRGRLERMVGLR